VERERRWHECLADARDRKSREMEESADHRDSPSAGRPIRWDIVMRVRARSTPWTATGPRQSPGLLRSGGQRRVGRIGLERPHADGDLKPVRSNDSGLRRGQRPQDLRRRFVDVYGETYAMQNGTSAVDTPGSTSRGGPIWSLTSPELSQRGRDLEGCAGCSLPLAMAYRRVTPRAHAQVSSAHRRCDHLRDEVVEGRHGAQAGSGVRARWRLRVRRVFVTREAQIC
jgi:hypothetical protein